MQVCRCTRSNYSKRMAMILCRSRPHRVWLRAKDFIITWKTTVTVTYHGMANAFKYQTHYQMSMWPRRRSAASFTTKMCAPGRTVLHGGNGQIGNATSIGLQCKELHWHWRPYKSSFGREFTLNWGCNKMKSMITLRAQVWQMIIENSSWERKTR